MHSICHDIEIRVSQSRLFGLLVTADGLEKWWSKSSKGNTGLGQRMQIYFSEEFDWEMEAIEYKENQSISWKMTRAMDDWMRTRLSFEIITKSEETCLLRFTHSGWERVDDHFRRSSLSWALYLRILRRFIENGEYIPYEQRTKN